LDKKLPELNQVICGDCLEVMKGWPDNCIDSIVTDPPYGLSAAKNSGKTSSGGFMGQKWDYDVPSVEIWAECLRVLKPGGHLLAFAGTRTQHRMACRIEDAGFEIRDMIAWAYGCLSDDTEIMIDGHWGSYRDVIKGKMALGYDCERNVLEWQEIEDLYVIEGYDDKAYSIKSDGTDQIVSQNHRCLVKQGDGYVFKMAEDLEYRVTVPIVDSDGNIVDCDACVEQMHYSGVVWCVKVPTGAFVARRNGKVFITGNSGFPKSLNIGKKIDQLLGAERKVVGKDRSGSERNCMAGDFVGGEYDITKGTSKWEGYGTSLKPAMEPITVARKPLSEKNIVENVLKHGTGGLNIDGCRVGYVNDADKASATPQGQCTAKSGALAGGTQNDGERAVFERPDQNGRWPANFVHDGSDEVIELFPETISGSGNKHPSTSKRYIGNSLEHSSTMGDDKCFEGSTGSAARFFYSAKASKSDRDDGCHAMKPKRSGYRPNEPEDGYNDNGLSARLHDSIASKNNHPTVKPQILMQYLCRLVTPSGGIVLDPFAGSGSTCKAAVSEGFNFLGIEINPDYIDISYNRIEQEKSYGVQTDLFGS